MPRRMDGRTGRSQEHRLTVLYGCMADVFRSQPGTQTRSVLTLLYGCMADDDDVFIQ